MIFSPPATDNKKHHLISDFSFSQPVSYFYICTHTQVIVMTLPGIRCDADTADDISEYHSDEADDISAHYSDKPDDITTQSGDNEQI